VFSFMILLLHLSYFTWDKIVLHSFSSKIACSKLYSYTNVNQNYALTLEIYNFNYTFALYVYEKSYIHTTLVVPISFIFGLTYQIHYSKQIDKHSWRFNLGYIITLGHKQISFFLLQNFAKICPENIISTNTKDFQWKKWPKFARFWRKKFPSW
jgi:hypothetical protein